jgi:hypothetical protein
MFHAESDSSDGHVHLVSPSIALSGEWIWFGTFTFCTTPLSSIVNQGYVQADLVWDSAANLHPDQFD